MECYWHAFVNWEDSQKFVNCWWLVSLIQDEPHHCRWHCLTYVPSLGFLLHIIHVLLVLPHGPTVWLPHLGIESTMPTSYLRTPRSTTVCVFWFREGRDFQISGSGRWCLDDSEKYVAAAAALPAFLRTVDGQFLGDSLGDSQNMLRSTAFS